MNTRCTLIGHLWAKGRGRSRLSSPLPQKCLATAILRKWALEEQTHRVGGSWNMYGLSPSLAGFKMAAEQLIPIDIHYNKLLGKVKSS